MLMKKIIFPLVLLIINQMLNCGKCCSKLKRAETNTERKYTYEHETATQPPQSGSPKGASLHSIAVQTPATGHHVISIPASPVSKDIATRHIKIATCTLSKDSITVNILIPGGNPQEGAGILAITQTKQNVSAKIMLCVSPRFAEEVDLESNDIALFEAIKKTAQLRANRYVNIKPSRTFTIYDDAIEEN